MNTAIKLRNTPATLNVVNIQKIKVSTSKALEKEITNFEELTFFDDKFYTFIGKNILCVSAKDIEYVKFD